MGYNLIFIRKSNAVTLDNIDSILENTNVESTDFDFFSLEFKKELIKQFKKIGLKFEVFHAKEGVESSHIELNFPTYQISLFDSQISISIPYWDENTSMQIDKEIKTISNILIGNGFIGYDSQIGELITEKVDFKNNFAISKEVVKEHSQQEKQKSFLSIPVFLLLGVFVVVFLMFKVLRFFK